MFISMRSPMKLKLHVRDGVVLLFVAVLSSRSGAQLVETARILTPKTKDLGAIIDEKIGKGPKGSDGTKSQPAAHSKPAAATSPPRALPDTFSSDSEDPASILDINVDVLTRFSAALAIENAKREDTKNPQTRARYDSIGAAAGGFTPRQYFVLKARLRPFCEAVAAGRAPPDDLQFSYMPTEAMAIKPRCWGLLPALQHNLAAERIERLTEKR